MTRTERFLSGFASGYLHLASATLAGLWLTPFYLYHLGSDSYGLWLIGTQIVAWLLLLDFGVVGLLPREIAYTTGASGRQDVPQLASVVEKALTLAAAQTPLVLCAAAVALTRLPASWGSLRGALTAVLGLFVLTFPLRIFQAALVGMQDLAFVARTQFAAWGAGTLVGAVLVTRGFGLAALAAGWCLTHIVTIAACAWRLWWRFPAALPKRLSFGSAAAARSYIARSSWISVSQLAQVLLNGSDVMLIAAFLGPAAVVPYTCTAKLVSVLCNQPQAILQSAAPALSELRTAGDRSRALTVTTALGQTTLAASGLIACIVLAVNGGFVTWWVGAGQYGGTVLTVALVAAMLVRHCNTTGVYALYCFGRDRRLALTSLADGAVALVAGAVFIGLLGPVGAPLGAMAGLLLVALPANLGALAGDTGVSRRTLANAVAPLLWRCAAVAALAIAAALWLTPPTVIGLGVIGMAVMVLYAMAVLPTLLASPAGTYLRPVLARAGRLLPIRPPGRPASPISPGRS